MKILILGGTYFIGRHIALELASAGHHITLLNRGTRESQHPALHADRNDPRALRAALAGHSFDVVIDTSCYDATQALIAESALAGRYGRWIFLSTASVYSDRAARPLSESSPAHGSMSFGSYGTKKADAERVLTELCGGRLDVLRAAYVYGPGNNLARETFIWARLLAGEDIYVPGDGAQRVSFIHVDDLARAFRAVVERPADGARIYNVAHPQWATLREWVLCLARQAGVTATLQSVPMERLGIDARQFFPFRDLDLSLDVSRIVSELQFTAHFDLDQGLHHTFASYEREELVQMLRSSSVEIEIGAVLGSNPPAADPALSTSPRPPSAS